VTQKLHLFPENLMIGISEKYTVLFLEGHILENELDPIQKSFAFF
jgi:hypothetical protein